MNLFKNKKLITALILSIVMSSCSVFLDPGGNRKYDINISDIDVQHTTKEDDIQFKDLILPQVINELLTHCAPYSCRKTTTDKKVCSSTKILVDYHMNYKFTRSSHKLLFCTFILSYKSNEQEKIAFDSVLVSKAILYDTLTQKACIIKSNDACIILNTSNFSFLTNEGSHHTSVLNIQHIFVDYGYFNNRKKVKDAYNKFWNNIITYQIR